MSRLLLLTPLFVTLLSNAQAHEPSSKNSEQTFSTFRTDAASTIDRALLARQWGLREEELDRYRALMQGPLGTYSPHLDPLSALGIEAQSDAERQRYAELQVEAEAARVEKLLTYQRAYDQAWKDRYPGMVLINLPPMSSPLMNKTAERKAVFVHYECRKCERRVKQLHASGKPFDLYFVGSHQDDKRIREWAKSRNQSGQHP
jgi:integrating conjugative element protein (TIGR03759 family)